MRLKVDDVSGGLQDSDKSVEATNKEKAKLQNENEDAKPADYIGKIESESEEVKGNDVSNGLQDPEKAVGANYKDKAKP